MQSIFCFDLDNTLYNPNKNILEVIDQRIIEFMSNKFHLSKDEIYTIRKLYSKRYGSTLLGLIKEHNVNPQYYLDFIHDIDGGLLPIYDARLFDLLSKINGRKVIITNSYKNYSIRLLKSIGIYDFFENIFDIVDLNFLYKNFSLGYKKVLRILDTNARDAIMIDDVWAFLISAKNIGMKTVLVNPNTQKATPDFFIKDIYEIESILDRL